MDGRHKIGWSSVALAVVVVLSVVVTTVRLD
jgi:hypothetical protein